MTNNSGDNFIIVFSILAISMAAYRGRLFGTFSLRIESEFILGTSAYQNTVHKSNFCMSKSSAHEYSFQSQRQKPRHLNWSLPQVYGEKKSGPGGFIKKNQMRSGTTK